MKIFSFWEPKSTMPDYLKLCVKTWSKFIPNSEIIILDYTNIKKYIDIDFYGPQLFSGKFSLPQIADAIRCMLLEKYGGLWLDIDTIILNKNVIEYFKFEKDITFFGNELSRTVSIGVICAIKNSNFMKFWKNGIKDKLLNFKKDKDFWAYLGNSIIYNYVKEHSNEIKIFDVIKENIMPEKIGCSPTKSHQEIYTEFYFKNNLHLSDINTNMIMLHNSWTPKFFKCLNEQDFLKYNCTLSNILAEIHDIKCIKNKVWEVQEKINNKNEFILIQKDGTIKYNPIIPGLKVNFTGYNGLVKLYEPIGKFENSSIYCGTNSKIIIKETSKPHTRHGLNINARANNNKCIIGKDFGCWGVSICLFDESNLSVEIGNDCIMASGITIRPSDAHTVYDNTTKLPLNLGENIIIGNHVWICSNVYIKKGSIVPNNCVIGAFSVIMNKFNENNIVISGIPAQIIRRNINWDRRSAEKYLDDFLRERERERENK